MSDGEETPSKNRGLRAPWQPGESGNPAGRPKGARSKLVEAFWKDLAEAWEAKGKTAIDAMIGKNPGDFVKVVATQMPKEFLIKSAELEDVSDADLVEFIATLRSLAGTGDSKKGRNGTAAETGTGGSGRKPH